MPTKRFMADLLEALPSFVSSSSTSSKAGVAGDKGKTGADAHVSAAHTLPLSVVEQRRSDGLPPLIHHTTTLTDLASTVFLTCLVIAITWKLCLAVDRALKVRRMNMPVVPGGLPFLGQVLELIRMPPWDLMVQWMERLGPIYRFTLFGESCVVVADPALLREVLQTSMKAFQKDLDFTYKPFMPLLGTGLVTSEGQLWYTQRAMVSAVFRIEILEIIPHIAKRAVERLCTKLEEVRGTGTPIEIGEMFRHLTLQVIAEAILSLSPEESDQTFAKMYLPIVTEGNLRTWYPYRAYLPTPANFAFHQHVKVLNDYITSIIEKRWALRQVEAKLSPTPENKRQQDILDRILSGVDANAWSPSTIRQIRDEIKTFILAGHETSASMLTWALYELTQSEKITQKVVGEAEEVFGKGATATTPLPASETLGGLAFTQCCLKETLRKYSVVPIVTRETVREVGLGGGKYLIPKGTRMMILIQGVHHRADIWPSPLEFNPQRFLENMPEPFTFLPFIDGPRNCLGQHLALLETKIVLATLMQRFRFEAVGGEEGREAGRKHPSMVPVIPDDPGLMVLVR
jgi:cytochrome P450